MISLYIIDVISLDIVRTLKLISVLFFQYELKETGHTPELTAEHDGKEVPVKRQTAANRKPPLQKSRSQDADRQTAVSESRSTALIYIT